MQGFLLNVGQSDGFVAWVPCEFTALLLRSDQVGVQLPDTNMGKTWGNSLISIIFTTTYLETQSIFYTVNFSYVSKIWKSTTTDGLNAYFLYNPSSVIY